MTTEGYNRGKVIILGSGTCVPSLERSSCSFLLEADGFRLLFDLGLGTIGRLLSTGIDVAEIQHLFFSHLHPDHTGELVSFMFAGKYPGIRRRQKHLSVFGARGVRDFYDGLINVYGRWIEPEEGMMDILELDNTAPDGLSLGPMKVDSLPMEHISSSIGYRITLENGTSVAYTGDTDYCDNVVKLAENVDLFICESSTPDEMKSRGHLTPSFAGRIATEANVGNLVLTHFYPECDRCDMEKECRKTYSGPLVLARDLMEIEI